MLSKCCLVESCDGKLLSGGVQLNRQDSHWNLHALNYPAYHSVSGLSRRLFAFKTRTQPPYLPGSPESGFALGNRLLKVENVVRYGSDLQNARFAYLSTYHTTVGDEESPDEDIHLVAAMQFAGFCSVIGTMWAVNDGHTNEITSKFINIW
jgi:hypothetical protein